MDIAKDFNQALDTATVFHAEYIGLVELGRNGNAFAIIDEVRLTGHDYHGAANDNGYY